MKNRIILCCISLLLFSFAGAENTPQPAQGTVVEVPFGNLDQWITRIIKESAILGGETKTLYEIGPVQTIEGNKAYQKHEESPWATSSVMANVMGIIKTSCSVFPEKRGDGYCVRLETRTEHCKVLGMFNITVVAPGTIFAGEVDEPVRNTKNPLAKLMMGIPFTYRPEALIFDYKTLPATQLMKATGFGKPEKLPGHDSAEVCVYLQHRWEDENGNIYAKRVATAYRKFGDIQPEWVNDYEMPILYGDITGRSGFKPYMDIVPVDSPYYCKNSQGKVVPINELGWAEPDEEVTHLVLRFSASDKGAYIGSPGSKFWVDNIRFRY